MKGQINLKIRKRLVTNSSKYRDKWQNLGVLTLSTTQKGFYKAFDKETGRTYIIHKDEIAFVRLLKTLYGDGDYNVLIFGKGKNKGFRRFWDGLITDEKFFRRKESINVKENPSLMERDSWSMNTESFIGRYMKTKRPGYWYTI